MAAELYVRNLNGMPPLGTIGEAVAKAWIIRERFLSGFTIRQLVMAVSLGRTDPYLLASDSIGALISDVHHIRPLKLSKQWIQTFESLLERGIKTMQRENFVQDSLNQGIDKDKIMVAKKEAIPSVFNRWVQLAEEQLTKKQSS